MEPREFLPAELVFMPAWWHKHYAISFDESFYLDKETRLGNEHKMNQALTERFGEIRVGQPEYGRRPVIGSQHVAGGFVMPALMGCQIRFSPDQAPTPIEAHLTDDAIWHLEVPDPRTTWPMNKLLADMDALEAEFGRVEGDFDLDGVFNLALTLRGQQLCLDFSENPSLARRLLDVCARALLAVAECVRPRTGTLAIATNRMIKHVDEALFLHSNCSVQMISPEIYRMFLLEPELFLAERLQPYGIHHCGNNLHRHARNYAQVPAAFYDVGWGSDVAAARRALPEAFFSLRLSPGRMLRGTPADIAADTEHLLESGAPLEWAGLCCINIDADTPDENVWAMFAVVQRYRRYGA
jgi:uroporphyrinogen-III decarboxylase